MNTQYSIMKTYASYLLCLLLIPMGVTGQLCSSNPSFEGTSQAHVVPAPWDECGGSPDTQPGQWLITQPASDGNTYVSFLQSGASSAGYYEGASQQLSSCMVAGQQYTVSVDLAHSAIYNTASPGDCYSSFMIYGGTSICGIQEVLGTVGPIFHTNWQTYTFTFTPTGNWCFITFRPYWINACSGYVNILVDNFTCVDLVAGLVATTDATCNGDCDGTAVANPSSGVPPYTYAWSTGATTDSISGLCAGTYTVTITDNAGSTTTVSSDVLEPTVLSASISSTDVSCLGGNNGTAAVTTSGGTTPYTYSWSSGNITSSINNLVSGSYSVTIIDNNNCQVISSTNITDGGIVTASISSINPLCAGSSNGTATITVTDGVPPYTYLWDNGQITSTATSLSAGTYNCTITDINGCTTTVSSTLSDPNPISITLNATHVSCGGGSNGTATATISGGTGNTTLVWDDPGSQTTPTCAGLSAGTYTVTVTDDNNCTNTASIIITEPVVLAINTTFNDPGCQDSCNGNATVATIGGVTPYTYLWNDPNSQTTTTATGLCDGSYTVDVTDSNGCLVVEAFVLTDPPLFTSSIVNSTDIDCFGNCNGFAQIGVSNVSPPFSYEWNTGDTSAQITGLCSGSYDVTVTNNNGCTSISNATIAEPTALNVSTSSTNVSCYNACDGNASVTVNGGSGPYTYLWNNLQVSSSISNLCASPGGTTYNVTITDSNNCSITDNVFITQPIELGLTDNVSTPTTCNSNNGSACVTPFGGITPYTIIWDDPGNTVGTCINNVYSGLYNAVVTDGMGCQDTLAVIINDVSGPSIDSLTLSNITCHGTNNGTASATFSGGTPPLTFTWENSSGIVIANATTFVFNLGAGNYSLTIQDANSCSTSDTLTLTEPDTIVSAISPFTDISCFGQCDGTATINVIGGSPPYSYNWTNGQITSNCTAMCAGNNNIVITDSLGCNSLNNILITEPTQLSVTPAISDISCNGLTDGNICLSPSGGTGPYTYLWIQSGQTTNCISNLTVGSYDVDITDSRGCLISENYSISEPSILTLSDTLNPSTCGLSNGEITINPSGGVSPYTYSWDANTSFQSTQTATGLLAGTYTVTITDAGNCSIVQTNLIITDIAGPVIDSTSSFSADCFGMPTGAAIVYSSGGTNPLTYLWSNGQTTSHANGLFSGSSTVTVTDANNCSQSIGISISEPLPLILNSSNDLTVCNGELIQFTALATGGTPPYAYQWSNGTLNDTLNISFSVNSTVSVTATDSLGCAEIDSIEITVSTPINVSTTDLTICEGDTTTLGAIVSGGTGNYSYIWTPDSQITSTINVNPTSNATYTVTVSDGCSADVINTIDVTVNPAPDVDFSASCDPNPFLLQFTDNSSISSGNIISWEWNFNDISSGLSNTSTSQNPAHNFNESGIYSVSLTATSALGCSATHTINIQSPPTAEFYLYPSETTMLNPVINLTDSSQSALSDIELWAWDFGNNIIAGPGNGQIPDSANNTIGTFTNLNHTYTEAGIYPIQLTVTNPYGCKDTLTLFVEIKSEYILFAPNAFMPYSLFEENQMFKPVIIGMNEENFEFYVYNKWGDQVFNHKGTYNTWDGWNGSVNGGDISHTDVYVWLIKTEDKNGDAHEYIGHVTLLK